MNIKITYTEQYKIPTANTLDEAIEMAKKEFDNNKYALDFCVICHGLRYTFNKNLEITNFCT